METNSVIMIIVGLSLILVGFLIVISGLIALLRSNKTKNWPAVTGRILGTRIDEHHSTYRVNNQRRTRTTYEPVVSYEYQVGGTTYTGNKIQEVSSSYHRAKAEEVTTGYPVGSQVQVYCDPNKPEKAVLVPGGGRSAVVLMIGGAIMGGFGLVLGILAFLL